MRTLCAALLLAASASAYPVYLECANDTATRLKVGGGAIMAGPPAACGAGCACALAASVGADGATTLTITTTAAVNFAVRVNDGAGALSSATDGVKGTAGCPAQMYSSAGADVAAGTFKVTLTPAAANVDAVFTVGFTDKFGVPLSIVTYPPSGPAPAPPAAAFKCRAGQCVKDTTGVPLADCQQLCRGPAPPPPATLYKCTAGQCVASATGVSLADCQALCDAPAPPAPAPPSGDLYKCMAEQCVASATGVSLADCQQLCQAPAPPAPTPPSGALYRCTAGRCAASATGVDLATCQQLCKAPPPPGARYRCAGDQCVVSADGVDLPTCQQLCRAPTPPAPAPPSPSKTCWRHFKPVPGRCLKCIYEYVIEILESVELCLTLRIEKCVVRSTEDIENLVEMIIQCSTPLSELGSATPVERLLARLDAPGAPAGLRAAGQRLRAAL